MSNATQFEFSKMIKKVYLPIEEYTLRSTIGNLSSLENQNLVVGPNFCLESNGEWHVEYRKTANEWFCFFLFRHDEEPALKVEYTMVAYDFVGKVICEKNSKIVYDKITNCHNLFPTGIIGITGLCGDGMSVTVKLEIFSSPISLNFETLPQEEDLHRKILITLKNNYKDLFLDPKHPDVTLKVNNEENFLAHKNILSMRSPVFERMFNQKGMLEQKDSIVYIDDISALTFHELVSFLYCGELGDYDFEMAIDLYYAADKYEIEELRQYCGLRLISNLTRLNAGKALILFEQHDDKVLKDKVFQFLFQNYHEDCQKKFKDLKKTSEQ